MFYCGDKKLKSEKEKQTNLDIIRFLLERNANKDYRDYKMRSCLDLAQKNDNLE